MPKRTDKSKSSLRVRKPAVADGATGIVSFRLRPDEKEKLVADLRQLNAQTGLGSKIGGLAKAAAMNYMRLRQIEAGLQRLIAAQKAAVTTGDNTNQYLDLLRELLALLALPSNMGDA